jgi:hypothetical protein
MSYTFKRLILGGINFDESKYQELSHTYQIETEQFGWVTPRIVLVRKQLGSDEYTFFTKRRILWSTEHAKSSIPRDLVTKLKPSSTVTVQIQVCQV